MPNPKSRRIDMINRFYGPYRWLSNFWNVPVKLGDIVYPSTENAYQAAKTFDMNQRAQFINVNAGRAKRLGRTVTMRPDWNEVKLSIMADLTAQKYAQEPLTTWLLDTGDQRLVEGNYWHDNFWGDCGCVHCKDKLGANNLGRLIMATREELRRTLT
jgi:ribA/ribD-fused uncharacterized protein